MNSFIDLKNINLIYNKDRENAFQALFKVNLQVKKGEFVVIFGPSGCGKSSLLNVIAGLEKPDKGTVKIDNQDLLVMKEHEKVQFHRRKMGMVFQSYNLISTLNVLDNVALPQMFNNQRKKKREKKARDILERFGIGYQWKKIPTELSGGQQQRIGIARSIINDPQIILADEPIGNLDTKSANNVMEILGNLNKKEGKTIVLVSHNPENIVWGSHIIYMKDGKIVKEEMQGAEQIKEFESSEQSDKSDFDKTLDQLAGFSQQQTRAMINPLKAKMLTESFLIPYEKSQLAVMEKNIENYLLEKIDAAKLLENFDKSTEQGGAGMDYRIAKKFFQRVDKTVKVSQLFTKEKDINKKALIILNHLGTRLSLRLGDERRVTRLGELIKAKLSGKISHGQFKTLLNSAGDKQGVGLDRRTAKKVIKELDLIFIVGYGGCKRDYAQS